MTAEAGRVVADDMTSLHEAFDEQARRNAERPAVEDDLGVSWTYAELESVSLSMALGITELLHSFCGETLATRERLGLPPVALLMPRSCSWVATCIACMRLGLPVLGLSGDLKSQEEERRNQEAILEHKPVLFVVDEVLCGAAATAIAAASKVGTRVVETGVLMGKSQSQPASSRPQPLRTRRSPDDALYLCYTGGTTSASKCVVVTHRMALHELVVYPQIAPLQCSDRILHQSSVYWGATAFGIFDISWACGGCLVLTEAGAGPAEVTRKIRHFRATVVGIVPSVLDALEQNDCPSLRVVLTWGEALAASTVTRWQKQAHVLDLLIATEYWLVLVADHSKALQLGQESCKTVGFRPVLGTQLTLLPPTHDTQEDNGRRVDAVPLGEGEVGELYIAGPMVSQIGYSNSERNDGAFVDLPIGPNGAPVRHFRTRDLARKRKDGTLEYCGRADGFAKVGGKWLDLASVERQLVSAGCKEASLVWDEQGKRRHAAVVLDTVGRVGKRRSFAEHVATLQRLLPPETQLHVLPVLPKNPSTGKVHRRRVLEHAVAAGSPADSASSNPFPWEEARYALRWGFRVGARVGVRGPTLAPFAWQVAPGLVSPLRGSLAVAEGTRNAVSSLVSWHRACGRHASKRAIAALPYVVLLLLDAHATGLRRFADLLDRPLGLLGTAFMICCVATPWLLSLLAAAGATRAQRARGGSGWLWVFWSGFPLLADQWYNDRWSSVGRRASLQTLAKDFKDVIGVMRKAVVRERDELGGDKNHLLSLKLIRCAYCHMWSSDGTLWNEALYCPWCTQGWNEYILERGAAEKKEPPVGAEQGVAVKSARAANALASPEIVEGVQSTQGGQDGWRPGLNELDFSDQEVDAAFAGSSAASSFHSCDGSVVATAGLRSTTPVARLVERYGGISAVEPSTSLESMESLKVIALVSALRRELGIGLAALDVVKCATLEDLELLCARTTAAVPNVDTCDIEADSAGACPSADATIDAVAPERSWAIYAIPQFWQAPVGWLIRLDEVPDCDAMRAACCALVRRHAALRARPYATAGDSALAQLCNQAAPVLDVLRALLGGTVGRRFAAKAGAGFLAAWPRIVELPPCKQPRSEMDLAHFEYIQFATASELKQAAWLRARSRGFKPPASIAVLVLKRDNSKACDENDSNASAAASLGLGVDEDDVAFLHVAVNHAASDAASIVPIVTDLLELHRAARSLLSTMRSPKTLGELATLALERAALPPAPNGLALSQSRLAATLLCRDTDDSLDLSYNCFFVRRRGCDHYVRLRAGAVRMLEIGTVVIGIPLDHLFVAVIAVAFAEIAHRDDVRLSLTVPMRDGMGEGQSVGNFASSRHLLLRIAGRSLLAVCLELSQRIRRREWSGYDVMDSSDDRVYINLRGIPKFDGAAPVMEKVNTGRFTSGSVKNIMEMFVDQETDKSWALSIGIQHDLDGNAFARALRRAVQATVASPLSPAVPVGAVSLVNSTPRHEDSVKTASSAVSPNPIVDQVRPVEAPSSDARLNPAL
eukprot:TRINITY_DN36659_c0_g1_i1.p1 TRINITY_DN36659_c0_g1~~TRINITY_DN36659_c0_g1_i1.p1  ORF type:complete len:1588 (+),score=250.17 TRINITY_DN36659_c0_g1_i1:219-4766(+)